MCGEPWTLESWRNNSKNNRSNSRTGRETGCVCVIEKEWKRKKKKTRRFLLEMLDTLLKPNIFYIILIYIQCLLQWSPFNPSGVYCEELKSLRKKSWLAIPQLVIEHCVVWMHRHKNRAGKITIFSAGLGVTPHTVYIANLHTVRSWLNLDRDHSL